MVEYCPRQYKHLLNYRSGEQVLTKGAQPALAATGSTDELVRMRDLEGRYRDNATFWEYPIPSHKTTLILVRLAADVVKVWSVLLAKGYVHARINGCPSTKEAMHKLLNGFDGPINAIVTKLSLRLELSRASSSASSDHDMMLALFEAIATFRQQNTEVDVYMPQSRSAFVTWLSKNYDTDVATGREKLLVSSIHQAKGLEAEVVYLLQPGLCPLQERLKLKDDPVRGWEAIEEPRVNYVARSRAIEDFFVMEHFDGGLTRGNLLSLWMRPQASEATDSESTSATASAPSSQDSPRSRVPRACLGCLCDSALPAPPSLAGV